MRILIYWEQESWGGVDTHLLELLSTWPSVDDEFVLMVNEGNSGFDRLRTSFEALPNVRCVSVRSCSHNELGRRMRKHPAFRWAARLFHFLQPVTYRCSIASLAKYFAKEGRFDVLLANNGGYPAAWGTLCALEAGAHIGIPARILVIHHAATASAPFMGWFEQLVDRRVSRFATALLCISWATRATLLTRRWIDDHLVRIRVIHHRIAVDSKTGNANSFSIRGMIAAVPGERLLGIAGRIEPYKGHEDLMFALARMSQEMREQFRLVILGAGEDEEIERLRRIAANLGIEARVHFLGYVPGRPIDLIAQFDLLAMVTRNFEGFGLTLAEAMAVGVPILATRVGAVPEFVDEATGFLVNPGAPQEIADALADFLGNPEEWARRAITARQRRVAGGISMAAEYRRLFVECLAEGGKF